MKIPFESLQEWEEFEKHIEKAFIFPNFSQAISFVVQVALVAEKMNHHPDIEIIYNKVRLKLTTKDSGGLSELDFKVAKKIDEILS
jgi:4a-hydroxytetrahydrobiopterin dehydratase